MPNIKQFNDILEAANDLPIDDQETLIDILNRRIHDIRRADIVKDVKSAQKEHSRNQCKPTTPDDLMKELIGREEYYFDQMLSYGRPKGF